MGEAAEDYLDECYAAGDDYDAETYCTHENFEVDWEGRASCDECRETWWATPEQIENQQRHEREYAQWVEEQVRRERWDRFLAPFREAWQRVRHPFAPRAVSKPINDDELPF